MAGGTFIFDNGISVTGSASASFSRAVATLNPEGATVSSGDPRFDRDMLLAGVEELTGFGSVGGNSIALDSGFDENGSDSLLVVVLGNVEPALLRVFRNPANAGQFNDQTMEPHPLSAASAPNGGGLLAFSLDDEDVAYAPHAACVCHGFIALWCSVLTSSTTTTDAWDIAGSGMLASTDKGANWDVLFNDLGAPIQTHLYRGNHWSLHKYFVPYPSEDGVVRKAWLVAADYRVPRTDLGQTTEPVGGRFYVVRIQRENAASDWSVGDGNGNIEAMFDMDAITVSGNVLNSRHAHAGGIVAWVGDEEIEGVRLVGFLGDGQDRNRTITATFDDHEGDYATDQWDIVDGYFGRGQLTSGIPSPPGVDDGVYDPQNTSCLQARAYESSPDPSALFMGGDNTAEVISIIRCPDAGKPSIGHVRTVDTGLCTPIDSGGENYRWAVVQQLRTLAPELGTPIVAAGGEEGGSGNAGRYWYQPGASDADNMGLWANFLTIRYASNGWALPFGDKIIVSGQDAPNQPNLGWRGIPELVRQRPIIISPGGKNMLRAAFVFDTPGGSRHTVTALTQNGSNQWIDGATVLSPQPPSMCDRVFKVKTLQSTDNLVGLLHVATQNPGSSHNQTGWSTSAELLRQFRFLILNNSHGTLANQTQPSTALISLALRDSDTTTGISTHSKGRVSNHTRWIPHTLAYGGFAISSGPRILARIVEQSTSRSSSQAWGERRRVLGPRAP